MTKLSFWQTTAIGLGNIVGAGIFVLAGSAITAAGPSALIAFLLAASLAMMVGLNNAELASTMPDVEGGVYSFAKVTLGDTIGFLVGWFRLISYGISGAAVALGFSAYCVSLGLPPILHFPVAILLIVTLALIEMRGLSWVARAEEAFVVITIGGLVVFVGCAIFLGGLTSATFTPFVPHGVGGLLVGANIAFFAYSGFNTITTLTPDVQEGEKTVPRAILAALAMSCLLYSAVVLSLLVALHWSGYGMTANPLALALSAVRAPPAVSLLVAFSAITATVTVTLSLLVAGSRVAKQMGEDDVLPRLFGKGSRVPTMVIAGIMIASLGLGNVGSIALIANFGVIFSYLLSGVEVIVVRRRLMKRQFVSPGFPYLQVCALILSTIMLVSLGEHSLMVGVVTLVVGLILHGVFHEFTARPHTAS